MGEFRVVFMLDDSFGPLKKRAKEAIMDGREHDYSNESIIETALNGYDVVIYCGGRKIFNATVYFNEFLYELLRFGFYAITGEIPENVEPYGQAFKTFKDVPEGLDKGIRILKEMFGSKFNEVASKPFLRSLLGSHDPSITVYVFEEGGCIYFVSLDYKWVCKVPIKEFVGVVVETVGRAIRELESVTWIFEENGIKEYGEMIEDYKKLLGELKDLNKRLDPSISPLCRKKVMLTGEFRVVFVLDDPFGPLKKRAKEVITDGRKHNYPNETIIGMALNEYDVFIYCGVEEIFNATVYFNEFLYELLRFGFYAITGEIPENLESHGLECRGVRDIPEWLSRDVGILKGLLGDKFRELTSKPFLASSFGSYDPTLGVYLFKEDGYTYLVSLNYRRVCRVPVGEFVGVVVETVEGAVRELESATQIFEESGIKEYGKMINDYKKLLRELKELSKGAERG